MPRGLRFRLVVLPQIARAALPALVNEMTLLIKVSPAVAVIGVTEVTRAAVRIGATTYQSDSAIPGRARHLCRRDR